MHKIVNGEQIELTEAEETALQEEWVIAKENSIPTIDELRKKEFNISWTQDEFQEAVFEKLNGDSTKYDILNAKRDAIKVKYPKT